MARQQNRIDPMLYKSKRKIRPLAYLPISAAAILIVLMISCNPFAPKFAPLPAETENVLGNRQTIQGFFEYFRNAYELRDTTLYGQLLAPNFKFTFFNFSNNREEFFPRDVEMQITYNMFKKVRASNLQWNNYVFADTLISDTFASVERNFNLNITNFEQAIFRSTGSARLTFIRAKKQDAWRLLDWYDKSDF